MLGQIGGTGINFVHFDTKEFLERLDVDRTEEFGPLAVEEGDFAFVPINDEALDGVKVVFAGEPAACGCFKARKGQIIIIK